MILYHGTGARREQSIKKHGLTPKMGSFVYASPNRDIAEFVAAGRAELEDDWALVVAFYTDADIWEVDPLFPDSLRSREKVDSKQLTSFTIMDPKEEMKAYKFMKTLIARGRIWLK